MTNKKSTPYRDLSQAKQRAGLMSNTRVAWAITYRRTWVTYFYHPTPIVTEGLDGREVVQMIKPGQVRLVIDPAPQRVGGIDLTTMTVEELDAAKFAIDYAFALARPICADNDRRAAEALEAGDDSHFRVYRSPPTVVVRQRGQREYLASLQGGLDGLAELERSSRLVGLGALGSPVPDREPRQLGAPDNAQEVGGDPVLRDDERATEVSAELPAPDPKPRHAAPPS